MWNPMLPLAACAILALAGCQESPADTAKDVAKAREAAAQKDETARRAAATTEAKSGEQVAAARSDYDRADQTARAKLTKVEAEAMVKSANAEFDVAVTDADGRSKIANEKCDGLKGVDKDACMSTAAAELASAKAAATSRRDAALVMAEHHE